MKKKIRKIIVNDEKYVWSVIPNNDDGGNIVKIWKDKVLIFDKWLMIENITPSFVEEIISDKIFVNMMLNGEK